MTLQKQVLIWAAIFAVLVLVLWLLSPILLPFLAGFVLAYFLDPVADRLQKWGFSRLTAALLIVLVALVVVITIPLSVLIAFILMKAFGITSNIMSLAGVALAVGDLVDAGIVMVENAMKTLSGETEEG